MKKRAEKFTSIEGSPFPHLPLNYSQNSVVKAPPPSPSFIHSDLYITQRRVVISFQKWNLIIPSRALTPKTFFLAWNDSIYMKGGSGVFSKAIPTGQIRMTDGRCRKVDVTVSLLHGNCSIINTVEAGGFFVPCALSSGKNWEIFSFAINQDFLCM